MSPARGLAGTIVDNDRVTWMIVGSMAICLRFENHDRTSYRPGRLVSADAVLGWVGYDLTILVEGFE